MLIMIDGDGFNVRWWYLVYSWSKRSLASLLVWVHLLWLFFVGCIGRLWAQTVSRHWTSLRRQSVWHMLPLPLTTYRMRWQILLFFYANFARLVVNILSEFCIDSINYLQKNCFYFLFHNPVQCTAKSLGCFFAIFKLSVSYF